MNNKPIIKPKEDSQPKELNPSQKEDRDFFAELYEEMTDPVKLEIARMKKEREEKIKEEIKDYGLE
jgi:hypothetical protein